MRSKNGNYFKPSRTSNGTFRVRFYDETDKLRSVNVKTKTELDHLLRTLRRQEELDEWFPNDDGEKRNSLLTFAELAEKFLEHRESVKEVSESCVSNYRTQLKHHVLPVLGLINLRDLTIRDIESLAKRLKHTKPKTRSYASVRREISPDDDYLSPSYRREILTLVCSIAKFGFLRDYLHTHPFKAFELPDSGDTPYDYWRPVEEDRFLDWLQSGGSYSKPHGGKGGKVYDRSWTVWNHEKVYEVVLFALRTGMRKGEITALRMDDVSLDERLITVRDSWSPKGKKFRNKTKNGSYRRIEMNQDVHDILWNYRDAPGDQRIFEKVMTSHTIKNFSKLTRLAGVREIHFHALRHTFLTNIANGVGMDAPVDIMKVKELAGHSDIKTTMVYVHSIGVKDSSSRQWSREERKAFAKKVVPLKRKEA